MTVDEAYVALGLRPGAGESGVRRAFRRLVLELHPDRAGGDDAGLRHVVAAYGVALAAARGEDPFAPPAPPPRPRERFVCPCCDDSFAYADVCPRCAMPLHDELTGQVTPFDDVRVGEWIVELKARGEPMPSVLERNAPAIASWGLLGAGTLALFAFVPVAAMFLGYGALLMAMRAVRGA
jgi:hypothetical protein